MGSDTCCARFCTAVAPASADLPVLAAATSSAVPAHATMAPPTALTADMTFIGSSLPPPQCVDRRRRPRRTLLSRRKRPLTSMPSPSALVTRRPFMLHALLLALLLLPMSAADSIDMDIGGKITRKKRDRQRDLKSGIRSRRRTDSDHASGGGDDSTSGLAHNVTLHVPTAEMETWTLLNVGGSPSPQPTNMPSVVDVENATGTSTPEPTPGPSASAATTDNFVVTIPVEPILQETDSPTNNNSSQPPTPKGTSYPPFTYFDDYDDSMDGARPRPRNDKPQAPLLNNNTVPVSTSGPTTEPWLKLINAPTLSPSPMDISGRQQNGGSDKGDDGDDNDDNDGDVGSVIEEVIDLLPSLLPPSTDAPASATPTAKPSKSPTTEDPTREPTKSPSANPTRAPTSTPTDPPTVEPTLSPVTASPTTFPTPLPSMMPQVYPTTHYPTRSPSKSPSALPTSAVPTPIPVPEPTASPTLQPTSVPTATPTQAPTLPIQQFLVELEFIFDDLQKLEDSSIILWEEVTAQQIYDHLDWTSSEIGMEEFIGMGVNTRIRRQIQGITGNGPPGQVASGRGGERKRRRLQADTGSNSNGTPLTIMSVNVIKFRSPKDYTQAQIEDHVAKAFNSDSDRERYISDLKATNDRSFRSINAVVVIMDGAPVPEAPTPAPTLNGGGKSNEGVSIWLIVGPLIGGVLVIAAVVIMVISRRQKKRKKAFMRSAYDGTSVSKFVDVEASHDDVSTLGDPVGVMFSSALDVKDTADNSVMSADYDYKHAFGTRDAPTASTPKSDEADRSQGSGSGRATLSTVTGGLGKMDASLFDDDVSFEKQYCEPEERIEIDAPAGKLGVVIDTPVGGVPVVHAIKDTSILAEKVRVGDQLVSVDDVDCTQLSAIEVSKLISSRANNPSRILVFIRLRAGEQ